MSSELAKNYHSITIGDKNTWDDWHIVPASRPLISAPRVKTSFISIPGGDGALDLTEVLAGRPTYERRTGSWEFIVMNDYGDWATRYSDMMAYLQGRQFKIILDDDPEYYYLGRVSVNEWRSEPYWSRVVFDYNVDPYKRNVDGFGDKWLWDPFNFESDSIHDYHKLVVNGTLEIDFVNESSTNIKPVISASNNAMQMTYSSVSYSLDRGPNVIDGLSFPPGTSHLRFSGNGEISIESTGGKL